jgi:hypothetical protein
LARVAYIETRNNRDLEIGQNHWIVSSSGEDSQLPREPRPDIISSTLTTLPEHTVHVGTAKKGDPLGPKQVVSLTSSEPDRGGVVFKTVEWGSSTTVSAVNGPEERLRGRLLVSVKKKFKRLCRRLLESNNTG